MPNFGLTKLLSKWLPHAYYIAGNVCGDYNLQFVVENDVCRFKVCRLLNRSFYTENIYKIFSGYNACGFLPKLQMAKFNASQTFPAM